MPLQGCGIGGSRSSSGGTIKYGLDVGSVAKATATAFCLLTVALPSGVCLFDLLIG